MKRARTPATTASETTALERIMTCLNYRLLDARNVLIAGYDMRLPEADALVAEACVRYLAGIESISPDPTRYRAQLIASLDLERDRRLLRKEAA